jgi:hypothetical protein
MIMKPAFYLAFAMLVASAAPIMAQQANAPELGEVVVTANRQNARYAQQDRPVVGLRRQADSAVIMVAISSEAREEDIRKREIHTMLNAALDRAAASGMELVTGSFELTPVTKANYKELPLYNAGRVDTSQVSFMIKVKLAGSTVAAEQKFDAFIKGVPVTGRGAIDKSGSLTLTIINPDQYRDSIVQLVAENAKKYAGFFGSDYAVQINGIDGQVAWSQVSGTDVFLYMPYRYTIVPK